MLIVGTPIPGLTVGAGVVVENAKEANDAARNRVATVAIDCDVGMWSPLSCARYLVSGAPRAIYVPTTVAHNKLRPNPWLQTSEASLDFRKQNIDMSVAFFGDCASTFMARSG